MTDTPSDVNAPHTVSITSGEFKRRFTGLLLKGVALFNGYEDVLGQYHKARMIWGTIHLTETVEVIHPRLLVIRRYYRHHRMKSLRKILDDLVIVKPVKKPWWSRRQRTETIVDVESRTKEVRKLVAHERGRYRTAGKGKTYRDLEQAIWRYVSPDLAWRNSDYRSVTESYFYDNDLPEELRIKDFDLKQVLRDIGVVWCNRLPEEIEQKLPRRLISQANACLTTAHGLSDDVVIHLPIAFMNDLLQIEHSVNEYLAKSIGLLVAKAQEIDVILELPVEVKSLVPLAVNTTVNVPAP